MGAPSEQGARLGALVRVRPLEAWREIRAALASASGRVTVAARALGVDVASLKRWLARLEEHVPARAELERVRALPAARRLRRARSLTARAARTARAGAEPG